MPHIASFNRARRGRRPHRLADIEFSSAFQPIFSPTHQRLVGYEALMRGRYDEQPVSPPEVFKLAEKADALASLDRQLQSLHMRQFARHAPSTWLFLNITPTTCIQPAQALAHLDRACQSQGLHPEQVVLEVVETATDDQARLLDFIHLARERGFQIAIDDFGVGDSNFERVWQLEPLIIKIDRSLLVNAEAHPRARQLLNGLVSMIRESGSLVLIEGIETPAQARIALATEADLLQGFLFGRPDVLGKPRNAPELDFGRHLASYRQHSQRNSDQHGDYLRQLRESLLDACHGLTDGHDLETACGKLLTRDGVQRCFLLDQAGIQQGGLASKNHVRRDVYFNPLYQSSGARWSHRDYFRQALERPHRINVCRPYVALPDAVRTVTLSACITRGGNTQVFCVDLHPDALFDGQLDFPDSL